MTDREPTAIEAQHSLAGKIAAALLHWSDAVKLAEKEVVAAAVRLDRCSNEFGGLDHCYEYLEAFWDACTRLAALPDPNPTDNPPMAMTEGR